MPIDPEAPPGRWPDPTQPRLLPAVSTPCIVAPGAPARPISGGDHHGGDRPGRPILPPGNRRKQAQAQARGEWHRGRSAAVEPEPGAIYSFLWPSSPMGARQASPSRRLPASCLAATPALLTSAMLLWYPVPAHPVPCPALPWEGSWGCLPVHTPYPCPMPCPLPLLMSLSSVPSTAPPAPAQRPGCRHRHPPQPSASARPHRPRCNRMTIKENPGTGTPPPGIKRFHMGIFSKYIFDQSGKIDPPRGRGPPKNFKPKIQPGPVIAGAILAFHRPSYASPWGECLWGVARLWRPREQLIYLAWWRAWGPCQGASAPGERVGQEKGDGTIADHLLLRCYCCHRARSSISDLDLSRKPDISGQPFPQVNMISNPLCKGCDIRTIWKN